MKTLAERWIEFAEQDPAIMDISPKELVSYEDVAEWLKEQPENTGYDEKGGQESWELHYQIKKLKEEIKSLESQLTNAIKWGAKQKTFTIQEVEAIAREAVKNANHGVATATCRDGSFDDIYYCDFSEDWWMKKKEDLSVSSNGKITDSKSVDVGSIPTTGAKTFTIEEVEAVAGEIYQEATRVDVSSSLTTVYSAKVRVVNFADWFNKKKQELMK